MGRRSFKTDKYISRSANLSQYQVQFYNRNTQKLEWLANTTTKAEAIEVYKLYEVDWYYANPQYLPKGISIHFNQKSGLKRYLIQFNHPSKKSKLIYVGRYDCLEDAQKARMRILGSFLEDLI